MVGNVGSDVEFVEGGCAGYGGAAAEADVGHGEGDDGDVSGVFEGVEGEGGWDKGAEEGG